ncbi:hypothetical protein [Haloferula sargassicola]|uniref:Uncharacterized protein n=1 Tax=Haloferula sargassicola TaxID=490096 RepID=A0ABP9USR9_9BACT
MKLPRNGSPLANASLLVSGVVLGAAMTWWISPRAGLGSASPAEAAGLSPVFRDPALNARSDDSPEARAWDPSRLSAMDRARHFREAGAAAAETDLPRALSDSEGIASVKDRADYVRGLYGKWAETDPEGALNHAQGSLPAGQLQSDAIGIAINKWGQDNPREAWLWAENHLSGPLKERALTDLMMGWTRRNPEEAAGWLASTGLTSQPFFNALPGTWAESDPQAALDWARSLPDGKAKDTAETAIANTVAQNNPRQAAEMFSKTIDEGDNAAVAITIADIWATTDPAAAAQWVAEMDDGPGKTEAASTLATVWAASDIEAAVKWSASIVDADMQRQVVSNIGTTWGAIDPFDALQWLETLPPEVGGDGITGAMYSWAGTDPVGMRQWIDAAGPDSLADRARQSLGDVLSQNAMPDAMDVALGMSSAPARDAALARYFREWRKRDDATAQDWLDANRTSLPATAQDTLEQVNGQVFQAK